MKANSEKTKQSKKATRRVLAGVLCGASVLSLVLSLVMPPISQAIANDAQTVSAEETVMGGCSYSFVNWEMLPARLNRGMLTPGHSAGGLQSVRCASARRRKAPCPA